MVSLLNQVFQLNTHGGLSSCTALARWQDAFLEGLCAFLESTAHAGEPCHTPPIAANLEQNFWERSTWLPGRFWSLHLRVCQERA